MNMSYPQIFKAAGLLLVVLISGKDVGCTEVWSQTEEWRQANSSAAEPLSDSASAHKITVGLVTLQINNCVLSVRSNGFNAAYEIKLPSACRFILDKGGDPQIVETVSGPTLLIVSSAPLADSPLCDTRVRAVVVENKRVLISQGEQRIRSCSQGPFDAKMFHVLAGSTKAP
jgi:hypothetical protein